LTRRPPSASANVSPKQVVLASTLILLAADGPLDVVTVHETPVVDSAARLESVRRPDWFHSAAEISKWAVKEAWEKLNRPGFRAHFFLREGWHDAEQVRREHQGQGGPVGP